MSSLTDLFNAAKNLVLAVNTLGQSYLSVAGTKHSDSLSAASTSVVSTASGRAVAVSVTTAGSSVGSIYDGNSTTTSAANLIASIPNTVGVHQIGVPVSFGIVVTTGTGQVATVIYS